MLEAMLRTCDRNGFSYHAKHIIGGATVQATLNCTHLIDIYVQYIRIKFSRLR